MLNLLDRYSLRARLIPAVIVTLPLGLAVAAWFPGVEQVKGLPLGAGITLSLGLLLAQLGRDAGKRAEPRLFLNWGGMPTTQLLSHVRSTLNPHTLRAVHECLRRLRPDLAIPQTAAEERQNPSATAAYASCVDTLRERTRDTIKYPLVFEENVNYGFRRNLWAMRPTGWLVALIGLASSVGAVIVGWDRTHAINPVPFVYAVVCMVLLVWWTLRITPGWVRVPAHAYAQRLIETCLAPQET